MRQLADDVSDVRPKRCLEPEKRLETTQRHTIVYAVDAQYWVHTCASIRSLILNNLDIPLDIQILANEPDDAFFAKVPDIISPHIAATISWLGVDKHLLDDFQSSIPYITSATYYRLMLDELLPEAVQRVLYIDGDTVIRGSLRELLSITLDGYVVAAVAEYGAVPHNERLGIPEGLPCFNAGVLYINLEAWRHENVGRRCIAYVQANLCNPEKLKYNDQDALNVVLAGRWKSIGPLYNYSPWAIDDRRFADFDVHSQLGGLVPASGPVIAHYAGAVKPWQGGSLHPYERDYWRYRSDTPYASRSLRVKCAVSGSRHHLRRTAIETIRRTPGGRRALAFLRHRLFPR